MEPDRPSACLAELTDAAKNWLAIDGLWFLAVEKKFGLDAAIAFDKEVWEQFSIIEARRIMARLGLPENGGLDALERALHYRLFGLVNDQEVLRPDPGTVMYRMKSCRTQDARDRKGLPPFPCKVVGIVDHRSFARTIDPRIVTECISCPPDPAVPGLTCSWRFTMAREGVPDTTKKKP